MGFEMFGFYVLRNSRLLFLLDLWRFSSRGIQSFWGHLSLEVFRFQLVRFDGRREVGLVISVEI